MDQVWRTAPTAALRVWTGERVPVLQLNESAEQLGTLAQVGQIDWHELVAGELARLGPADTHRTLGLSATPVHCRRVLLPDGCLIWLMPLANQVNRYVSPADQLELLRGFAGGGVIVRSVGAATAFWDDNACSLLGVPRRGTDPAADALLELVVPDDRDRVAAYEAQIQRREGRYDQRFRVLTPTNALKHLHALYEVRRSGDADRAGWTLICLLLDESGAADRHEQVRRDSEQLGRALDLANVMVWQTDDVTGVSRLNSVATRELGVADQMTTQAYAERLLSRVHPDDRPELMRARQWVREHDGVVDVAVRHRRPGSDEPWRTRYTRLLGARDTRGQLTQVLSVSMDVTEFELQRERLRALAERTVLMAESVGAGFWRYDPVRDEGEWDEQMRRLHGLPADAPVPKLRDWARDCLDTGDPDAAIARFLNGTQGVHEHHFSIRRIDDGAVRWLTAWTLRTSTPGGGHCWIGMMMDVTERTLRQADAREERERMQFAIDAAGIGVWEHALEAGASYWSPVMYLLRGFDADDPRPLKELIALSTSPATVQRAEALLAQCVADGTPYVNEFEVTWPDGTKRWIASTARVVRNAQGMAVSVIGVNHDVTARKQNDELRDQKRRAEEAGQAMSALMARVSHELRTPMNAVLGFATLLRSSDRERLGAQAAEYVDRILASGRHLQALIDDLLQVARAPVVDHELPVAPVALKDIAAEALSLVTDRALAAGVYLDHASADWRAWAMADRGRLVSVVVNLLSNGIKYNRPAGRVALGLTGLDEDLRPVPGQGAVRHWELSVRDTGRGLTQGQIDRLFEPFNRLGAERGGIDGAGIGLAVVRQHLTSMGGTIHVQSQPAQGSTFRVRLPAASKAAVRMAHGGDRITPSGWPVLDGVAAPATARATADAGLTAAASGPAAPASGMPRPVASGSMLAPFPAPTPAVAGVAASVTAFGPAPSTGPSRLKVLYIEDNPVNEMLVREMLRLRDDRVDFRSAPDAATGIEQALLWLPDVILTDLQLPDMHGQEVMQRLRSDPRTRAVRYIALSANAIPADVRSALEAGFDDYWTKPLEVTRFLADMDALSTASAR